MDGTLTPEMLNKLDVATLKNTLRRHNLSTVGKKADLIARIHDLISTKPLENNDISKSHVKKSISTTDSEFVNFIQKEFKDYHLNPETINPCLDKDANVVRTILDHQKFLVEYFKWLNDQKETVVNSRGLLLYHALGSGKSSSAVLMTKAVKTPETKIIVLIPASLRDSPWVAEFKLGFPEATSQAQLQALGIHILHYNAPNFMDNLKALGRKPFDNSIVIIDEVHNILNTLVNNAGSKRHTLYDNLLVAKNAKFIMLSGTPISNEPFELCYAINILRGFETFDVSKGIDHFNSVYFNGSKVFQPERFLKKIQGLVSYYSGLSIDVFPKQIDKVVAVPMSDYQWDLQQKVYNLEKEQQLKRGKVELGVAGSDTQSQLSTLTRARALNVRGSLAKVLTISSALDNHDPDDIVNGFVYSRQNSNFSYPIDILKDYQLPKNQFIANNEQFDKFSKDLSLIPKNLLEYSPKMLEILKSIMKSPGPCVVYSNFEGAYGISIFVEILKQNGISYRVWSGKTSQTEREEILEGYNAIENSHGRKIKVLCITSAGKEGISLRGVREVHVMEPWWNFNQTLQVIGRSVRICSHFHLPENERNVNVYRYICIPPKSYKVPEKGFPEEAIEMRVAKRAKAKMEKGAGILELLKKGSVDCILNKARTNVPSCSNFSGKNMNDSNTMNDLIIGTYRRMKFGDSEYFMSNTNQLYTVEEEPILVGMATLNLRDNTIQEIAEVTTGYTEVIVDSVKRLQKDGKLFQWMSQADMDIGLVPLPLKN
jgi:superfamily II DNA or RNA helicase